MINLVAYIILFYLFGFPVLPIGILLHGLLKTFTKYHIASLFSSFIYMIFGFLYTFIIGFSIVTFLLIKNYDYLLRCYKVFKQTMQNSINISKYNDGQSKYDKQDLETIEYVNDKFDTMENKLAIVTNKYNILKTKYILLPINDFKKSTLANDLVTLGEYTELFIWSLKLKDNYTLIYDLILSINFIKKLIDKIKLYFGSWSTIYNSYGDDVLIDQPIDATNNGLQELEKMNELITSLEPMMNMMGPVMQNPNFENMMQNQTLMQPTEEDMTAMFDFINKMTKNRSEPHISLKRKSKNKK